MSRTQKAALLVIWLGIVGTVAAVFLCWQVRQEWLGPWGYMTVRHNLLTAEKDVLVGDQWVPLPRSPRRAAHILGESRLQQVGKRPAFIPGEPLLPARLSPSDAIVVPSRPTHQAAVPASPRARGHAPVRTKVTPAPPPPPLEATAPLAPEVAAPSVEDAGSESVLIDPDLPIVRAPSPDPLPAPEAPPPADQVASADDNPPAVSVPDPTQQATAPAVCDPTAPGAVC